MPKYLFKSQYHSEAVQGIMKEGGTARREYIDKFIKEAGGAVESYYYAFGEIDAFVICDLPDTATAASISMALNSSGMLKVNVTPLISPEEVDEAIKKRIKYRAPGK